jgi:hypothetical protein
LPSISPAAEQSAESTIRDFVLRELPLAIYDPMLFRRPRVPVVAFAVELLEFDDQDAVAHAAGPVTLQAETGEVEQYLRVSVPVEIVDDECRVVPDRGYRAVYIVDLGSDSGACKETAALASA